MSDVSACQELIGQLDDEELAEFHAMSPRIRSEWALTFTMFGDDLRGLRGWERVWEAARELDVPTLEVGAAAAAATIHAFRGDHRYSRLWLKRANTPGMTREHPLSAAARAIIAIDDLDIAAAESAVEAASALEVDEGWAILAYIRARVASLHNPTEAALLRLQATCLAHFDRIWSSGLNGYLIGLARKDLCAALGLPRDPMPIDALSGTLPLEAARIDAARFAFAAGDREASFAYAEQVLSSGATSVRGVVMAQLMAVSSRPGDPGAMGRAAAALETITAERLYSVLTTVPTEAIGAVLLDQARRDPRLAELLPRLSIAASTQAQLELSPKERLVWWYLVNGYTAKQIAEAQFLSVNTIKSHLRQLYRKLGVNDRKAAVDLAAVRPGELIAPDAV